MIDPNHALAILTILERQAREHPSLAVTAAIAATQRGLVAHRRDHPDCEHGTDDSRVARRTSHTGMGSADFRPA